MHWKVITLCIIIVAISIVIIALILKFRFLQSLFCPSRKRNSNSRDIILVPTETVRDPISDKREQTSLTNCNAERLTDLVFERALEEVNELDRKCQRVEIEGNEQIAAKQGRQVQKKRNVMNARPSINFTPLVGYERLQCAGPLESRTIVNRLYHSNKFANISGGFRLYLRLITDAILNEICDKIDDQSDCFDKSEDMDLCISQVLRYAKNTREERNFTTNSNQETINQLFMMEISPEETSDHNNVKLQYAVDSLRQEFIQQFEDTYQRSCQNRNNLLYLIEALSSHYPTLTTKMILQRSDVTAKNENGILLIAPCKMDRIPFQNIEFKGGLIDKFEAERINAELEILAHRHEVVNTISHEQKDESLWQEISGQGELAKK
uniref:Uncharacterized protein n=2 Tax=Wuchereria bancrofti TaxID=6293 RepID=A0A1I8EI58_WUCBA